MLEDSHNPKITNPHMAAHPKQKQQHTIACLLFALLLALCFGLGLPGCSDDYSQDSSASYTEQQNADSESSNGNIESNGADPSLVNAAQNSELEFRSESKLEEHYEKHGIDMGFSSPEAYQAAANAVVSNPSSLYKTEQEDGDYVFYLEDTNEFVIVSTQGYLRTYFCPDEGIRYFNKQ